MKMLATRAFGAAVCSLIILAAARDACSTPEFSQRFKAKCRSCHIRNTSGDLNQTGMEFRKTLEKDRSQNRKEDVSPPVATSGLTAAALPADEKSKSAATHAGDAGRIQAESRKESEAQPPVPVSSETVYRWTETGGAVVFTDNLGRRPKSNTTAKKTEGGVRARTRATASPGHLKKGAPKAIPQAGKSAGNLAAAKKSYAHCMESYLSQLPLPPSSGEMMTLLLETEQKCSPPKTQPPPR